MGTNPHVGVIHMIYIIANTPYEGTQFAIDSHLRSEPLRIYTSLGQFSGLRFIEEDEVFVLKDATNDLKRAVRVVHDASWPRPHIFKEVNPRVRAEAR